MDWQVAFNVLASFVSACIIWVMSRFAKNYDEIVKKFEELPNVYARRDDVKEGFIRMEKTLDRIEAKLDHKQDKII